MSSACRTVAVCLIAALHSTGCVRQDRRLQQHQEAIQSLHASASALLSAWLAGHTSGTYTVTALEQTRALVEQERAALASNAERLVDPRGARLADSGDELSRLLALAIEDVRAADPESARRHLAALPPDWERNRP